MCSTIAGFPGDHGSIAFKGIVSWSLFSIGLIMAVQRASRTAEMGECVNMLNSNDPFSLFLYALSHLLPVVVELCRRRKSSMRSSPGLGLQYASGGISISLNSSSALRVHSIRSSGVKAYFPSLDQKYAFKNRTSSIKCMSIIPCCKTCG
jgi:hypothetical protein